MNEKRIFGELTDFNKTIARFKLFTRIVALSLVVGIVIAAVLMMGYANKLANSMKLITPQGVVYSSQTIEPATAKKYQAYNFVLNFARLFYAFDKENLRSNMNRALRLGDKSVRFYFSKTGREGIFQQVVTQGQIVSINEMELVNNLIFSAGKFATNFPQTFKTGNSVQTRNIHIEGELKFITPSMPDNPSGFFVTNFIENDF